MADPLWLAGREIERTWLGYLLSAGYIGLLGLFAGMGGMAVGEFAFEIITLAVVLLLSTPFFALDHMAWKADPVAARLSWLRTLPLSAETIVGSRMIAYLVAMPLNVLALFVPVVMIDAWDIDVGHVAWLAAAVTGLSLVGARITLCLEMSVPLRRWLVVNLAWTGQLIVAMLVLWVIFGFGIFANLMRAIAWNGPLVAAVCVAAGLAAYMTLGRLAVDLLRRRELAP